MVRPATSAPAPTTVGTEGIVDGRWIDEAVYRQALRNATDSNRRHLLQLYEGYKLMSVRTPFRDLLSAEQRASYFYIDRIEQWDAVAERFQAEVDKFRWLFNVSFVFLVCTSSPRQLRPAGYFVASSICLLIFVISCI